MKRGDVFVAVPGSKADGMIVREAAATAGAAAVVGEKAPQRRCRAVRPSCRWRTRGARWRWPRRASIRGSRKVIAAVTGTSGKTSVAAFTRQIWAALGHEAASLGTIGVVTPQARGLRLADHARSGRPASHAGRTCRRGRHASGDRGVVARPRPAPARRRAGRGGGLHQFVAATISTIIRASKPISRPSSGCSRRWWSTAAAR